MIGLGKMGRLHMMNCLHMDNVKVVAAADASKNSLQRAKAFGVENLYSDYHEMLSKEHGLDVAIITLPHFLHFDSVQSALEAGLNVFEEKPMANTVDECRKIMNLATNSGRKFTIGHSMRFIEAIEKMKATVENGEIGDLEVLTLEEVYNGPFAHPLVPAPVPEWWFDPKKSGGGVLIDLGYHLIDLFRFFVGDCKLLFSCLDHKFNLPVEDGAIAILTSANSSTKGIINVGWYQKIIFPKWNLRAILHGNAGYVSSEDIIPSNFYVHAMKEGTKNVLRRIVGKKIRPLAYTYFYESYYRELRHFFNCIEQDLEPAVSAEDGLRIIEVIEEAYRNEKRQST